jgi:hypothetical protein
LRQRLIAGAERGVRWHRRLTGPLPPLLQIGRLDLKIPIENIAASSNLTEKQVHQVERGDASVADLKPDQLGHLDPNFRARSPRRARSVETKLAPPRRKRGLRGDQESLRGNSDGESAVLQCRYFTKRSNCN